MRPLRKKQAKDVADMIADIYKVGSLTFPKVFQCDNGIEFKVEVTKLSEKHEVTTYDHEVQTHSHSIFRNSEQDPRRTIIQGTRCTRVERSRKSIDYQFGLSICMDW